MIVSSYFACFNFPCTCSATAVNLTGSTRSHSQQPQLAARCFAERRSAAHSYQRDALSGEQTISTITFSTAKYLGIRCARLQFHFSRKESAGVYSSLYSILSYIYCYIYWSHFILERTAQSWPSVNSTTEDEDNNSRIGGNSLSEAAAALRPKPTIPLRDSEAADKMAQELEKATTAAAVAKPSASKSMKGRRHREGDPTASNTSQGNNDSNSSSNQVYKAPVTNSRPPSSAAPSKDSEEVDWNHVVRDCSAITFFTAY